jgi:predicted DCC family thiol-disulfide oxidoreductase YuxK
VALHQRVSGRERPTSAGPPPITDPGVVLMYDAECTFCRWAAGMLIAWDRRRTIHPVAIQDPAGAELLPELTPEERLEAWHLITADGSRYTGGPAFEPLLTLLPGGRPLSVLAGGFIEMTAHLYDLVSANRNRIMRVIPPPLRRWGEDRLEERVRSIALR